LRVDLFDRLALFSRHFQVRRSAIDGQPALHLEELLRVFHGKTILEMEVRPYGKEPHRLTHQVGRPVSLIDGIAEVGGDSGTSYEVMETAPSGDHAKVRITTQPGGGQLVMLIGRRTPDHAPSEDALLDELKARV
jgi:hypothetical protein